MANPEEKAFLLVESFYDAVGYAIDRNDRVVNNVAKACAIICVDEILKEQEDWIVKIHQELHNTGEPDRSMFTYWQQVKSFLNK